MKHLPPFPDPVNETSARVVAGGVVTLATATVLLDQPWILAPLAYGFAARVVSGPAFSPLGLFATRVVTPRLAREHKFAPGPPKRLAQGMGLMMSTTALVLYYVLGRKRLAYAVLTMLIGAASAEAFAGYCVACRMFPLLTKVGLVSEETCARCTNLWSAESGAAA